MNFIRNLDIKDNFLKFYLSGIALIIFVGLLIPIFFSIGGWLSKFNQIFITDKYLLIYFIILSMFIYYLLKILYNIKICNKSFYLAISSLLILGLFFKFYYVFSFEQIFYSDFKTMWDYAVNIYQNGFIYPDRPQTERPLAFLVPIVLLFGTSEFVFKIFNVTIILFSISLISFLIYKEISKEASIIFFILMLLIPELYFVTLIPTHDIPTMFYLLLFILVVYYVAKNVKKLTKSRIVIIIFLLTLIGLLFDIQRLLPWPARWPR